MSHRRILEPKTTQRCAKQHEDVVEEGGVVGGDAELREKINNLFLLTTHISCLLRAKLFPCRLWYSMRM